MRRKLNSTLAVEILDALNVRQRAVAYGLEFESSTSPKHSSTVQCVDSARLTRRLLESPMAMERDVSAYLQGVVIDAASTSSPMDCNGQTNQSEIGTILEGRRLVGLCFDNERLSTTFNRSDLSHTSFIGAVLTHSTFNLARLTCCDLRRAQFHSCTFIGADFANVDARQARFSHCVFHRVEMSRWRVQGSTFYCCSFALSDLSSWSYDSQTTIVDPNDWDRCRRLQWACMGSVQSDCRVVFGSNANSRSDLKPGQSIGARDY